MANIEEEKEEELDQPQRDEPDRAELQQPQREDEQLIRGNTPR